ncbi:MAG: hypothetical protein IPK14_01310 [Blastocatellia bacterium]|nr:hypothetical protein [Blastocatellia bacterium]MBL8197147.1 hypothetical protein [Blastocatellia bacterium]
MLPFLPKKMAEEQDNEDELIKELIPWYLASEKENLVLLEKALAERNFPVLIEIGDKLYGHGKSFGFAHISILGKRIEIAAIQQDFTMLRDLVSAFKEYLQECCKRYNVD